MGGEGIEGVREQKGKKKGERNTEKGLESWSQEG